MVMVHTFLLFFVAFICASSSSVGINDTDETVLEAKVIGNLDSELDPSMYVLPRVDGGNVIDRGKLGEPLDRPIKRSDSEPDVPSEASTGKKGGFPLRNRKRFMGPNVFLHKPTAKIQPISESRQKRWFSSGGSSGGSRSRNSGSRSRSSSGSRSGGFRSRVKSGYRKVKSKVKSKLGWGSSSPRSSSRTSGRRSSNRGSSSQRRGFRNRVKSGYRKVKNKIFGGRKPSTPRTSSGHSSNGGFRNKIRNGYRKVKNKIFGGRKTTSNGGSKFTSTGTGGSKWGRKLPTSGTRTTPRKTSSWKDKIKSGISKFKNKISGKGRKNPPKTPGATGSRTWKDKIKSGIGKIKDKIGGGRRKPISPSDPRYNPKPSISNNGKYIGGFTGTVQPRKQSTFSKIKSKAIPFLKKPSTQRMLKKGAKWMLRKYKSRKYKNRYGGGAVGVYRPGYPNEYNYGHPYNRYSAVGMYGYNPYGYGYGHNRYSGVDDGYNRYSGVDDGRYEEHFGGRYHERRAPEVVSDEWKPGTSKGSQLTHGSYLSSGESLRSPDNKFEAKLDSTGDLILYQHDTDSAYWHTDTTGPVGHQYRLTMQSDNDLVLQDRTDWKQLWASGTPSKGLGFATLKLQNDGSLVVYDSENKALWMSNYTEDELEPRAALFNNQTMHEENDAMVSRNGRYYCIIEEGTGKLVIYDGAAENVTWLSSLKASGASPFRLVMQPDNNLVLYDRDDKVVWSTDTDGKGKGAAMATVTDDGRLAVIDSEDTVLWSQPSVQND